MKSCNLLFTVLALTLLVISCNGGLKKVTLHPIKTETKAIPGNDKNDTCFVGGFIPIPFPCPLSKHGTGCGPTGISSGSNHDPVGVGFTHFYDSGTNPCACWEYINCIFRGYVKFNVSSLKGMGIASAELKWSNSPKLQSHTIAWEQGEDCIKSIAIANTDWNEYEIPGDFLQGNPAASPLSDSKIVVTHTVIEWINGQRENNGWFFVGEDEELGVRNNNDCKAILSNLRLEVLASDKK